MCHTLVLLEFPTGPEINLGGGPQWMDCINVKQVIVPNICEVLVIFP